MHYLMRAMVKLVLFAALLLCGVHSYSRMLKKIAASAIGIALATPTLPIPPAIAVDPIPESMRYITERNVKPLPNYFGVGCFWHVQHEVSISFDTSIQLILT